MCIIATIALVTNREKSNIEIATAEKAETMKKQEEKNIPKTLTEIVTSEPNTNKFTYITSEDGIQVPVPKGYVASTDAEERYVNGVTTDGVREHHGGFVIYEKNAGETDELATQEIEDDLDIARIERNQWVWIPVVAIEDMYHVSENYIYANAYSYSSSSISKITNISKEPELSVNYDVDHSYLKMYLDGINRNDFLQEMREEFYNMLKSVATYGGFYIGRYETGNINQKIPVVRKGNSNIDSVNWYLMYKRCKNLKGSNPSVQTGMVWGIQWDEILKWIIDTGDKTYAQVYNSSSWGNHKGSGGGNIKRPTGYSDNWKANNVYDLAGNVWEWTMESDGNTRFVRGGGYNSTGSKDAVHGRSVSGYSEYTFPIASNSVKGCRTSLYITE